MKQALKQELYRVFHNRCLLVLLGVCLFFSFRYSSFQALFTEPEFVNLMDARYGIQHIGAAKRVMNAESSPAQTWEELYQDVIIRQNYARFLCYSLSLIPPALVLSIFQLGTGRERGTIRSCGLLGGSVKNVVLARLLVFYLLSLLILLPVLLLQTAVYAKGIAARYGFGVILRNLATRLLLDCSILSVYALLSLTLRRRGLRVILILLITPVLLLLNLLGAMLGSGGSGPVWLSFLPLPPVLHGNMRLFLPEFWAGTVPFLLSLLFSLAWVLLLGRVCLRKWTGGNAECGIRN